MAENLNHHSSETVSHVNTLADSRPQPVPESKPEATSSLTKDFGFLPIPRHLQYHENKRHKFGILLQLTFVFASTFKFILLPPLVKSVTLDNVTFPAYAALVTLAEDFGVSYSEVSRIPTLLQTGYAVGLLFISPLGDLVLRRPLLLLLVLLSGSLSIGLAVTNSIVVFEVLSFLTGAVTVTPQILIPLSADLAPPHRRAAAISITFSGLLFGILTARVLAGVISEFSSWRNVFYMAVGLQFGLLVLLYFVIPNYPAKDPGVGYFGILKSMAWFAVTEPILVQACIVSCASTATLTSFWITLTFLLGGPPYFYSDLKIGLFGLIGMLGVATGPFVGRFVDLLVPWNASVLATFLMLVSQAVQTGAGGISIASIIVACFGLDVGKQMQQVSLSTAIFGISHAARSRMNAVFIFSIFLGHLMGTATGTKVFVEHGWRATAVLSLAWMALQMVVLWVRGPHSPRKAWIGWQGGWSLRPRSEEGGEDAQTKRGSAEKGEALAPALDTGHRRDDQKEPPT